MAELHPQLAKDCERLGYFPLCHVLLMRDANYPWCILVPDREAVREIHQLSDADQQQLMRESSCLAAFLHQTFKADKMNIAALGNMVPQLHVHHIVRYQTDPAWPAPVWGKLPALSYDPAQLAALIQQLQQGLTQHCTDFVAA